MKLTAKSHALALAVLMCVIALPAFAQTAAAATAASPGVTDSSMAYSLLHHPRALAKFLHLSSSQTTQLLAFDTTLQQTVQPLRQARAPLCTQLITDLTANPPQPAVVGADTINLYDNKQEIADARKAFDTSFSGILNPAQLAAYDALKTLARFTDPEINVIGDCPRPTS